MRNRFIHMCTIRPYPGRIPDTCMLPSHRFCARVAFCAIFSTSVVLVGVVYSPESSKFRKFRKSFRKNLSDGISGNFGKFFPGIPGNSGNPREFFRKFGGFSQNTRCGTVYTLVKRYENPGKSGKISPKTRRTEFPEISGNFFRGFPGIPEIRGNFSRNSGVFSERALRSRVHVRKTG